MTDHPDLPRLAAARTHKFDWDLVPLPAGPSGDYAVIGQAGIGVFKQGKHAEAAADFLAFFTNPQNSAKLAAVLPAAAHVAAHRRDAGQDQPAAQPEQLRSVVIDGITNGVVKPGHTG